MRSLRLARIAAEAEGVRLRRMAQRTVIRLAIVCIALFFLFCAVAVFHVGVWFLLRNDAGWSAQAVGLAIAGFDFVIALVLLAVAALSGPGRVEREALAVRRQAWENTTKTLSLTALLLPALRLAVGLVRRARGR